MGEEIVTMPALWPEAPYLVVERRRHNRVGDDWCFLKATSDEEVDAVVYLAPTWPPPQELLEPGLSPHFVYDSLEDLQSQGWKPSRSTDRVLAQPVPMGPR